MFTLEKNTLILRAPEVHEEAQCQIDFQRTLRIPDDNQEYPLPPGLGNFPLTHVDDYSNKVPESWITHGGVFLPMYQAEALWINFNSWGSSYPFAIKIATGKINAVSGEPWQNELLENRKNVSGQDYIVVPGQPWLDGYCVSKGLIRQFVAMPLGEGYTAEEQLTGEGVHGGIQIIAYPMKKERYEAIRKRRSDRLVSYSLDVYACEAPSEMGLAPGGLMHQEIYEDEYGIDAWDTNHPSRCFVHILNSAQYLTVTDKKPPTAPLSAKSYTEAGLPWFEYYNEGSMIVGGSEDLAGMDSVAAKGIKKGEKPLPENVPVNPTKVVWVGKKEGKPVRDGEY